MIFGFSPGFIVSVLATLTTGLITLWLLYEDWAVYHSDKGGRPGVGLEDSKADRIYGLTVIRNRTAGDNTITAWTRYYERLLDQHHQSHWLVITVFVFGLVLGHLLWH